MKKDKENKDYPKQTLPNFITYLMKNNGAVPEYNLATGERILHTFDGGQFHQTREKIGNEAFIADFCRSRIHPDDVDAFDREFSLEKMISLVDRVGKMNFICRLKQEDGVFKWRLITVVAIPKDEEYPCNILLFIKDIDKEQVEEERQKDYLKQALRAAEHAGVAKSEFLSRMSHEIRTPLNAINGYLSLAQADIDDREMVEKYLDKAQIASGQLIDIISDILDMSSIGEGKLEIIEENFLVSDVIDYITKLFSWECEQKNISFDIVMMEIKEEKLSGDEMRVCQILTKLVSNAIKFTPEGGQVKLTVSQKPTIDNKVFMCFEVEDTGIGMSESFLKNIWTAFEQEDLSVTRRHGGTGLGLSITRNLVSLMKGTIEVNSEKGRGSVFRVEIPFRICPHDLVEKSYKKQSQKEAIFRGKRVMLAEDDPTNMEITKVILSSRGLIVDEAWNGQEALELMKGSEPGSYYAILMDVRMPVMDGYEATRRIRALDREDALSVPIIAMTANAFSEDAQKSFSTGMNEHVNKPIDIKELFWVLSKYYS